MNIQWRNYDDEYRGLGIRCAPGVHAAAFEALRMHLAPNSRILDLASGSGAFASRLLDANFCKVTTVERDTDNYGLSCVPCISLDLDRPFADSLDGPFDAVTAIEIIEHLSNPVAFLSEVRSLLRPGGIALISTPNIATLRSRFKFLLRGDLCYFDEAQYRFQRHISPLLPTLVPMLLAEAELEPVYIGTAGTFDGPLRRATLGMVARGLAAFSPDRYLIGECLVIVARANGIKNSMQ